MRNSAIIPTAFLLIFGLLVTACKKEEAPTFSEEITAHWVSQSVKMDDTNLTGFLAFTITLNESGSFTSRTTTVNIITGEQQHTDNTGHWTANETTQTVTLNFDDAPTQTWTISNLTDAAMTAKYTDEGGHKYEINFAQN